MKWQKKLTKKEMKHVKETTNYRPTLKGIKANRAHQKKEDITCYECRSIAIKLGIED